MTNLFDYQELGTSEEISKKLDHLAKLEKQIADGLLVELPCKVGGVLYTIFSRVNGKPHIRRLTLTHQNMGYVLARIGCK